MSDSLNEFLVAKNLNKSYGSKKVLQDISITITKNDCVGIIGKNGAGKTTILKILIGLLEPDSGSLTYNGIKGLSIETKRNIGFYLGTHHIPEELTGRQYLNFINHIYCDNNKKTPQQLAEMFLYFFGELDAIDTQISKYSMGMTQKIGICGALVHQPNLLILDEPFTALDPISCNTLIDFINAYKKNNTIIISSHDLNFLEKTCNQIVLIDSGKIKYEGNIEDFTNNRQIKLETSFFESLDIQNTSKEIKWLH